MRTAWSTMNFLGIYDQLRTTQHMPPRSLQLRSTMIHTIYASRPELRQIILEEAPPVSVCLHMTSCQTLLKPTLGRLRKPEKVETALCKETLHSKGIPEKSCWSRRCGQDIS